MGKIIFWGGLELPSNCFGVKGEVLWRRLTLESEFSNNRNLFILYLFFSQSLPQLFDSKFYIILARGSTQQGIMRLHNLEKPWLLLWVISDSKFNRQTTLHLVKYKKLWVPFSKCFKGCSKAKFWVPSRFWNSPHFHFVWKCRKWLFHFQFCASFSKYFHRKRFRKLQQTLF